MARCQTGGILLRGRVKQCFTPGALGFSRRQVIREGFFPGDAEKASSTHQTGAYYAALNGNF
jgi:hypothetical protein